MKIFLHSDFNITTGYGNSATHLAIGLAKKGVDVYPICRSIGLNMPQEFVNLLTKEYPIGQYIDAYINFSTFGTLEIPKNLGFIDHRILYTMWEQTKLPKWFKKEHLKEYTNIFVPCSMNIESFSEVFNKEKIRVVPLGVDILFYLPIKRNFFEENLKVCANGALTFRKGIDILTDVMLDERIKKLPIEFHLKNSQMTVHPKISGLNPLIHIYQGTWTKRQIRDFYLDSHIMICPNRGEALNQVALEFLATGGVVITHSWGGHQVWANKEYCEIIPYKLVKVTHWKDAPKDSMWAEVSSEDIIKILIDLYNNRQKLVILSQNAIKVSNFFSFENMTNKFLMRLEGIKNERS